MEFEWSFFSSCVSQANIILHNIFVSFFVCVFQYRRKKKHVYEFHHHLSLSSNSSYLEYECFWSSFILFFILTLKTCLSTDQSALTKKVVEKRVLKNKAKHQREKECAKQSKRNEKSDEKKLRQHFDWYHEHENQVTRIPTIIIYEQEHSNLKRN